MTTYTKLVDYASKDALLTGNPSKLIKGVEIGAEFDAIATADATNLKPETVAAATSKTTPVDADTLPLIDSAASNTLKKLTWANLKATVLTWLQGTVFPSPGAIGSTTPAAGSFTTLSATGNVTLGDTSTDTLNVGNGGLIKDSAGNLGLGVTPSANAYGSAKTLFVSGDSANGVLALVEESISSAAQNVMLMNNAYPDGVSTYKYKVSSQSASYYKQVSGTHTWFTALSGTAGNAITFTQAMTLEASGNLLIGTTTDIGSGAAFLPIGSGSGMMLRISRASEGTAHQFLVNSNVVGSIYVTASATTYNTSSDQRLKENITDAESASRLIDSIQVRQFDWKSDGSHQRYGMVAQELALVAPEAVYQPADHDDMMAVDYSKLVPMLVKEVQELRARLAALETK
jgi:Chaperone of endosialidase